MFKSLSFACAAIAFGAAYSLGSAQRVFPVDPSLIVGGLVGDCKSANPVQNPNSGCNDCHPDLVPGGNGATEIGKCDAANQQVNSCNVAVSTGFIITCVASTPSCGGTFLVYDPVGMSLCGKPRVPYTFWNCHKVYNSALGGMRQGTGCPIP